MNLNSPQRLDEILKGLVLVREGFHKTTHLEAFQGLLQARVPTHGVLVFVVYSVQHTAVTPHVI